MSIIARTAAERRAEIQANALRMGINETYISELVDEFYTRIHDHGLLGPIFKNAIGEDWEHHLSRMKDFWSSVTMNTGRYSGKPVPVHQKLVHVEKSHFHIWLTLFRQTLTDTAPNEEIVDYFMERAERISQSLQLAMFGVPGLPGSRP